jgi:CMP-N-acetylneuraminic acid synthetase
MIKENIKCLAIIPARGGSKGLPRKNIKPLLGKPLVAWTIEQAKKSKYIDRIVVSTEDMEIAEIAKEYGAEIIERPEELAKDESPTIDAIFHALEVLKAENYNLDIIILLQPTSPLRKAEDIDNAMELFFNSVCEAVVSVCEVEHSPYWSFKIEDNYLKLFFGDKYWKMRRQDLPKVYVPNGAIYISTPENLRKYKSFYCFKTIPYIMPPERSVDIDKEIDFMLAELLMRKYGIR